MNTNIYTHINTLKTAGITATTIDLIDQCIRADESCAEVFEYFMKKRNKKVIGAVMLFREFDQWSPPTQHSIIRAFNRPS